MKKDITVVKDINKMFPASNEKYPACFIRGEDGIVVSGETHAKETFVIDGKEETFDIMVVDYYNEFNSNIYIGGVHKKLQAYLDENDLYFEWENPGCGKIYRSV